MATFWEGVAHSVYRMFVLYFDYCNFSYFPLWFLGRDFGSDCISSWSLLQDTRYRNFISCRLILTNNISSELFSVNKVKMKQM